MAHLLAPSRPRAAFGATVALAVGLLAPVALVAPAQAATVSGLATGFQIDGDMVAAGGAVPKSAFDWNDFITGVTDSGEYTFTPTGPYKTVQGYDSTGIVDASFYWDNGTLAEACDGSDPSSAFPGSVKPASNPWVQGVANVNSKADGCSSGGAYEVITDSHSVDHYVFYQYWTRLSGDGDMSLYQLLEGAEPGRCDDILVEFNYDSPNNQNEAAKTQVNILTWTPEVAAPDGCDAGDKGAWTTLRADFPHEAKVGVRTEGPALPGEPETFGEIAIDLTFGSLFDEDGCTSFEGGGYVTRTGNSSTAELIDAVGPGMNPIQISNCGAIEITKASDPDGLASDAEFRYELVRADSGVLSDGTVVGIDEESGDEVTNTFGGTADHGIAGEIGIGDTHTWSPIFGGDYELEETIESGDPFVLESIVCTVTDPESGRVLVVDATEEEIPVFVGETTECVITNAAEPASLELEKAAAGIGDGVAWSFDVTVSPDPQSGSVTQIASGIGPGSDSVSWDDLRPGETYTLTETPVLGWTAGTITCEVAGGALADASTEDPTDGFQFVATPGLAIECALTNTAVPGKIVVTKTAVGDNGTFRFELTPLDEDGDPDGAPLTQSTTTTNGEGGATFSTVLPGSRFAIAEVDPGSSWTAGDLTCEVTAAGSVGSSPIDVDDFTINPGDSIACAITNEAKGTITIVKVVEGADGEFSFTGDWLDDPFTIATHQGSDSASFEDLLPGDYSVSEALGSGYDGTKLVCSDTDNTDVDLETLTADITLDAGEDVTCTFTNSEWGVLLVDKITVPAESKVEFGFSWAAAGEGGTSFTLADEDQKYTTVPISPGLYSVTESSTDGWTLTGLECTDPADDDVHPVVAGATATVTVGLGETVVCTYTNAQRGPLTFDKIVTPTFPVYNASGTWTVEYTLTVRSYSYVPERYDLEDDFRFDPALAVVSADVAGPLGVALNADWDGAADTVIAEGAEIPARGTHTYTVTVVVDPPEVSTVGALDCGLDDGEDGTGLLNGGEVSFWGDGTDTDDACASIPAADLTIEKNAPFSVDFEKAVGPTDFDYTIAVENLGPQTAYDTVLEDQIDVDLEVIAVSTSSGSCSVSPTNFLTCELGDLAPAAVVTVTVSVQIPVDYPLPADATTFTVKNTAETSTATPETTLENNQDDASTVVFITLAIPPEDPDDPDLTTLALTGLVLGLTVPAGFGLIACGLLFLGIRLGERRTAGRHTA